MYGTLYSDHPEILLNSMHDYGSSDKKMELSPILRTLVKVYIRIFGIPDVSFQLRAKYFIKTISELSNFSPKSILDAGSGIGFYSQVLSKLYPSASILGIDIDQQKLEFCQTFLGNKYLKFQSSDMTKLDMRIKKFDLIVNIDVLEHIESYSKVLKQFYKVLSPGGKLYIHTPQINQKRFFINFFANWHHDEHVREGFEPNKLAQELKKIGFTQVEYWHGIGKVASLAWELNQILLSKSFILTALFYPFLLLLINFDNFKTNRSGLTVIVLASR